MGTVSAYLHEKNSSIAETKLTPKLFLDLLKLVDEGVISLQAAREKIFPELVEKGTAPERVLEEKGLRQVSDESALEAWIEEVIAANPKVVQDFKSGKESSAMFLVGQVMRKSQGKANPGKVQKLVRKALRR